MQAVVMGNCTEERPYGRWGRGCKDEVAMNFIDIGCEDVGEIELGQDHFWWRVLVLVVVKLRFLLPQY
jgi:hypothetical protein